VQIYPLFILDGGELDKIFKADGLLRRAGTETYDTTLDPSLTTLTLSGQFTSTLATGTSPFAVTSTTLNTNLNAELWGGYKFADYLNQAVKTTSSPTFNTLTLTRGYINADVTNALLVEQAGVHNDVLRVNTATAQVVIAGSLDELTTLSMSGQLTNTLAIGTKPFVITSTTMCDNLNADLLDGQHASAFYKSGDSPTFAGLITPAINGGTSANDDITIQGTTHATRATSYVILQPTAGNVGIGTTTPVVPLHVNGVIAAEATAFVIPAGIKGIFLKYNEDYEYGSLWCYDYPNTVYKGLGIDAAFTEFQVSGVKKAEMQSTGIFDVDQFADIQTTGDTTANTLGKGQVGIAGLDYASFGYRGHNGTNYAVLQAPDFSTYIKAGSGKSIVLSTNSTTLAMTLASGGTVTIPNLAGVGDRYVYVDENGQLKAGAAYP